MKYSTERVSEYDSHFLKRDRLQMDKEGIKTKSGRLCPIAKKLCNDCYCYNLSSQASREKVRHYCKGNFKACEIYKRLLNEQQTAKG